MEPLTDKQQAAFDFIATQAEEGSPAPSIREIASALGLSSPSAAQAHLRALERKGWIATESGQARSLRLLGHHFKPVAGIPLLGSIPAGHGDLRTQEPLGLVHVEMEGLSFPKGSRMFALRVTGDSMIGKHIVNNDTVVFEQGATPRNGEVVAALIDGQSTLKTYVVENGKAFLRAENPQYPNLVPVGELVIQGVMRSLIRGTQPKKR